MKFFKITLYYGIIIFSVWFIWHTFTETPCDNVVEYDIAFDDRFRISQEEFIVAIERAEAPWEQAVGTELFQYVPGADFKINLIFSEEQNLLYQGNDLSHNLDSKQSSLDSLQSRYQSAVRRYESSVRNYQQQLQKYEQDVIYWNDQGGAPSDIFAQLEQDSAALDAKFREAERLRQNVNNLAEQNNKNIEIYNENVSDYNQLFRETKQFDAGNTDGREMNIYSYDGIQELVTLITHEFGHVLGIDHLENESAIMHYLLSDKNKGGELTIDDIQALNISCRID